MVEAIVVRNQRIADGRQVEQMIPVAVVLRKYGVRLDEIASAEERPATRRQTRRAKRRISQLS